MFTTKFDPSLFFQGAENVALHVPAGELFGLGRRTLELPPAWGAVISRADGSDSIVSSGGTVESENARTVVFMRMLPFDVVVAEEALFSRDGFECRIRVHLRFVLVPEREELAAFRSTVLAGHRVAKTDSVSRLVSPVITRALTSWLGARDAEQAFSEEPGSMPRALAEAIKAALFTAGLALCGEPNVEMDSPSYSNVRRIKEDASRRSAEIDAQTTVRRAAANAQSAHLDHLGGVVAKLREMTHASPGTPLADLVRTFPEGERGQVFEAAFAKDHSQTTKWIVVAAGEDVLYFDPSNLQAPSRRFSISGAAGAVRSIQFSEATHAKPAALLLGAATGVYRIPIDQAEPDSEWLVPCAPHVRGGFNAVCSSRFGILASHSELGLWNWPSDGGASGEKLVETLTRGARTVRDVQVEGAQVFCTVDDRVAAFSPDRNGGSSPTLYSGSRDSLTCLRVGAGFVFAGNSAGEVLRWSQDRPDRPERMHHGALRAVESLWLSVTQGVRRLIFTDTSPFIHALVLDEGCATRYEAGGQTLRRVESADDLLVGITELRDRFLVWKVGQPKVPFAVVNIAALNGRTIQDLCLIPVSV